MASNKNDKDNGESLESESPAAGDWRPDYFPTSAKPVFLKISFLFIGILILCLFLAYCSVKEQNSLEKENLDSPNTPERETVDEEIF